MKKYHLYINIVSLTHREGKNNNLTMLTVKQEFKKAAFFLATWKVLLARGAPKFKSVAQLNSNATEILQVR